MLKDEHFKAVAKSIRQKIREFKEAKEQVAKVSSDSREGIIHTTLAQSSEVVPSSRGSVTRTMSLTGREMQPLGADSQRPVCDLDLFCSLGNCQPIQIL